MVKNRSDAYDLLKELGASDRLIRHGQLVCEAACCLLVQLHAMGVQCDIMLVELGSILHDAGKIQHTQELSESGSLHEDAGEILLLSNGVQPEVARCCSSHGAWNFTDVSFEERIVTLADKLWKGKREAELELAVIDEVSTRLGVSRWDVFEHLDSAFEEIAAGGSDRLSQSWLV